MPLLLDDPRWLELDAFDGQTDWLIEWLNKAYAGKGSLQSLAEGLHELRVLRQGKSGSSKAMYALAPHFIALAGTVEASLARALVIYAGLIHGASETKNAVPCPDFLEEEFAACRGVGSEAIREYLAQPEDFNDFVELLAALAGFSGYGRFGRVLEGFAFIEGRLHHDLFEEPFDEESW